MKQFTLYSILAASALSFLAGCNSNDGTVTISGSIDSAKGEKLALMHLSGSNPVLVDTITLGADGSFRFKPTVEKGGPDFFCLVMNGQTIPVVSDTLQTPIVVNSTKDRFSTAYTVNDELNNSLRQAVAVGSEMRRDIYRLTTRRQNGQIAADVYADSIQLVVNAYKQQVLTDYIYQDPSSPVSYYLLFETVSGLQVFDPLDVKDNRAFGAVANLWLNIYPNSPRTSYLEQRTREGIAKRVKARMEQERADSLIQNAVINTATFLDLELIGVNDELVPLSSVNGKGQVTLLDFTAYFASDVSVPHNLVLSNLYEKYKDQGLRIYQVCMDIDVNFWKVSASNVPWTVVRDRDLLFDENGTLQYSGAAHVYNVSNLPTTFVMGRDGTPLTRVEDDSKLADAVAKAL